MIAAYHCAFLLILATTSQFKAPALATMLALHFDRTHLLAFELAHRLQVHALTVDQPCVALAVLHLAHHCESASLRRIPKWSV